MNTKVKKLTIVSAFIVAIICLWAIYSLLFSVGLGVFTLAMALIFDLQFSYWKILLVSSLVGALVIGFIVLANRKVIKEEIDNCFPKE